jgi:hypothetical protein
MSAHGECTMAKLKKAPGRLIGRWKAEAIAANGRASDEHLAKIINDTAKQQGYAYKITPEKVRTKTKKSKTKKTAAKPTHATPDSTNSAPAPKAAAPVKISLEDIRALKGLVDRIGADKLQELAGMLSG